MQSCTKVYLMQNAAIANTAPVAKVAEDQFG
jgi:hypothetical protein